MFINLAANCQSGTRTKASYGGHLISASFLVNNGGRGLGLQYEHLFSQNDKWALIIPYTLVSTCIERSKSHGNKEGDNVTALMLFIEPGVRCYPTKSSGVFRYSIGANIMFGIGQGKGNMYKDGTNQLVSRTIAGLQIVQGFNLQLSRHIRFNLDLGVGAGSDDGINESDGGGAPIFQLNTGLGYRW